MPKFDLAFLKAKKEQDAKDIIDTEQVLVTIKVIMPKNKSMSEKMINMLKDLFTKPTMEKLGCKMHSLTQEEYVSLQANDKSQNPDSLQQQHIEKTLLTDEPQMHP